MIPPPPVGISLVPPVVLAVAIAFPLASKPGVRVTVFGVLVEKVTVPVGAIPLLGSVADVTIAVTPSVWLLPLSPVSSSGELRTVVVAALVMVARNWPVWHDLKLASPG